MELRNWKGDELKRTAKATASQRLEIAAILVKNEAQRLVSDPAPPHSQPGQPPHKDTGRLRASITYEVDKAKGVARVGSNLPYAKFLELGTRLMAARPFLRRAFNENYEKIRAILKGGK